MTATDPDAGDTLIYGLTDSTDAGSFTIDAATGQLRVGAGADLDYETRAQYSLTVTVSDGLDETGIADSSVDDTVAVSVTLTDVDEAPPEDENTDPSFSSDSLTRSVEENSPAGTPVGAAVTASDPDDGDTLTYGLAAGADAGSFTIDAATGQLRVGAGADLDYETQAQYSLTVTVSDGLDDTGSADSSVDDTVAVLVTLTDADEAPPPPGAPEAPVNLRAIGMNNATLLVWSNPDDDSITGYQFRVRSADQSEWRPWRDIPGSGSNTTSRVVHGLTKGVEYRLELRTKNAAGAGAAAEVSFTLGE